MNFLIFSCSLGLIFLINYLTKEMVKSNLPTRFLRLLQFVKFAPILAFLVLLVLVLTTFHSKEAIRLSHAWYVAQFWAYTAFLYCSLVLTKNKLPLIPMIISFIIAIYNTPLFHYEELFTGRYIVVSDIFGILMFVRMWIATTKLTKRTEAANDSVTG
jgi:putative copper export protein